MGSLRKEAWSRKIKIFDQDGNLANDSSRDFLKRFVDSYANWVRQLGQ